MTEHEHREREPRKEIDITEEYLSSSPSELAGVLSNYNTDSDILVLNLDLRDADPVSINQIAQRFSRAKISITATSKNYQLDKDKYQSNIDWKIED